MSEKLSSSLDKTLLQDVTTEAREHIATALAREQQGTARPPRLYIELPGHTINYSVHESDCSGHWTEDRSFTLSDAPHRIVSVTTGQHALQVQIARDEKDNYGLETCLYEPDVRRARFYVSEMEPDDLMLNAHLHEQLTAQSSVWIDKPYLDELSGWKGEVGVRAAHPLSSPVSVRDDYRVYALETRAIHGIQSFYSEELGCTMAHVVIEGRRGNLTTTSDWAPLSDFEFYQYNYSEADAAIGRIAYEATQLLDGMIDITPVNLLLADATPRVMYDVLYDRYSYSPSARFIIGDVIGDAIHHVRIPAIHRFSDASSAAIAADRIMNHDGAPWIVDDTNNLATPLLSPSSFTHAKKRYGVAPIEQLIVREQTE